MWPESQRLATFVLKWYDFDRLATPFINWLRWWLANIPTMSVNMTWCRNGVSSNVTQSSLPSVSSTETVSRRTVDWNSMMRETPFIHTAFGRWDTLRVTFGTGLYTQAFWYNHFQARSGSAAHANSRQQKCIAKNRFWNYPADSEEIPDVCSNLLTKLTLDMN